MSRLKHHWCLFIILILGFMLIHTLWDSSTQVSTEWQSESEEMYKLKVGFSQIETDNPWRTAQINSFREALLPDNIGFIYHEPEEYSVEWQFKDIQNLIKERVNYLVIVPADLKALTPVLQEAKDAHIPVILIDQSADTIDSTYYMSLISADYLKEGAICAQMLADKYPDETCNIVEIYGAKNSPSAQARSQGFHTALKNYPNLHVIGREYGDFDRVTAQKAMENALVKATDTKQTIHAVFAHSDEDGLGALQAIKTAGISPQSISIVSINGIQDVCKAILANEYLGTVESNPKWGFLVKILIQQRENGYPPFPSMIIPYSVITSENAASYYPTAY